MKLKQILKELKLPADERNVRLMKEHAKETRKDMINIKPALKKIQESLPLPIRKKQSRKMKRLLSQVMAKKSIFQRTSLLKTTKPKKILIKEGSSDVSIYENDFKFGSTNASRLRSEYNQYQKSSRELLKTMSPMKRKKHKLRVTVSATGSRKALHTNLKPDYGIQNLDSTCNSKIFENSNIHVRRKRPDRHSLKIFKMNFLKYEDLPYSQSRNAFSMNNNGHPQEPDRVRIRAKSGYGMRHVSSTSSLTGAGSMSGSTPYSQNVTYVLKGEDEVTSMGRTMHRRSGYKRI